MEVVAAAVIAGEVVTYGSLDAAIGTIVATFVLAGIFQVLMGVLRIGQYVRYMPYPVISGFMSGIGLIIIFLQIFPFFGMGSPAKIIDVFTSLGTIPEGMNMQALGLAAGTIEVIYLFPKVMKKVPSTLVALIVFTIAAVALRLDVPMIGDIPKGLPDVHLDTLLTMDWHHPMVMVIPALTFAALGAIDSLLTSVVADNKTKSRHYFNRELIGQGIGNMGAGLIGGLLGAGATMRTIVNIDAGGRTRLSGVVHGVLLLLVLLGAGAYAKLIPLPVLAGILITVGLGIIDYKGLKDINAVPRSEAVIMLIVLVLTVFADLLQAVAVCMVLASILFMKKMGTLPKRMHRRCLWKRMQVVFWMKRMSAVMSMCRVSTARSFSASPPISPRSFPGSLRSRWSFSAWRRCLTSTRAECMRLKMWYSNWKNAVSKSS